MKKTCTFSINKILLRTLVLGIVASASHFAYELSGRNVIVGMFNPVNESVWEHLKFMFFPFLIWWIIMYLLNRKKCDITLSSWVVSAAVSLAAAPIAVLFLYYAYTGALGIESLVIDILLVFVCYFLALCLAGHLLRYLKPGRCSLAASIAVIVVICVIFIWFTFCPPQLPVFYYK